MRRRYGHETLVERQIRLAQERGEFDDLPGAGKPLPGLDGPDDENWWVKGYLRREGLSTEPLLPTPLQLRREIERLPDTVAGPAGRAGRPEPRSRAQPADRGVAAGAGRARGARRARGRRRRRGPLATRTAPPCATAGPPSAAPPTPPRAPTVRGARGGAARPSERGVQCGRCTQRPVRSAAKRIGLPVSRPRAAPMATRTRSAGPGTERRRTPPDPAPPPPTTCPPRSAPAPRPG